MTRFLLIIGGGIAAYKALELVRMFKKGGHQVTCVLTRAGSEFVTPLSLASLSGAKVYDDLFSLTDEVEMGHIELSRSADALVVAPATADLMAKMANGFANDLASTLLLAANKPILLAPAMNHQMWHHPATQRNLRFLKENGCICAGPDEGEMACGEFGLGRLAEVSEIYEAACQAAGAQSKPLAGKRLVITSGPTREPIDGVRYLSNHSSGKQGHAIAASAARGGAEVHLVSGPVSLPPPEGVRYYPVETAREMAAKVETLLPADCGVFVAAVADWRASNASEQKLKKNADGPPRLALVENPDILAATCRSEKRPGLVIGFAAETENHQENGARKREAKGCDWLLVNDVSAASGTFGGDHNQVTLLSSAAADAWPVLTKTEIADRLTRKISETLTKD